MRNILKKVLPKKIKRLIIYLLCAIKVYGKFFARLCLGRYATISNQKKYPTTLQLPITYKCNFDCVMCGMRKMISNSNITPDELRTILSDKLFCKIKSVGLNGGEPFLLKNLEQYVYAITESLPKLSDLFIITNGYPTMRFSSTLDFIHNTWLNIAYTTGIIPAFLFFVYCILSLKDAFCIVKYGSDWKAALLILGIFSSIMTYWCLEPVCEAVPSVISLFCFIHGYAMACFEKGAL